MHRFPVTGYCLWLLLAVLTARAEEFRIAEVGLTADGKLQVRYDGVPGYYHRLFAGDSIETINTPVALSLGNSMIAPGSAASGQQFFRVQFVPFSASFDTDIDGIPDDYELFRPGQLDGLNAADAGADPDGNGLTFLQEYRAAVNALTNLTTIVETSPTESEDRVAVTRESILYFSNPLSQTTVLGSNNLYAEFGGRRILSRVELSSDRRKATLFYLEPLPASARVRVTFDSLNVVDVNNRVVDADGDGFPGGTKRFTFDTLSIAAIPTTAIIGRVFASELIPDPVDPTKSTNKALAGVTITVDGAEETLRATTDATGFFRLEPCPAGRFFVTVDGRTAIGSQWPNGDYYPFVGKAWEAVAGVSTNLAAGTGEIFLPLIKLGSLQPVSATADTTITFPPSVVASNPALNGVSITVPANALFSDNGARGGRVGIAPVSPDRLPEPLPPGLEFPLVITIQTDGPANFDRPVPVRFPNLPDPSSGQRLLPGAKTALVSFNHDIGEWEVVGSMTVTDDGVFAVTDPGVGVRQPGWHGTSPITSGGGNKSGSSGGGPGGGGAGAGGGGASGGGGSPGGGGPGGGPGGPVGSGPGPEGCGSGSSGGVVFGGGFRSGYGGTSGPKGGGRGGEGGNHSPGSLAISGGSGAGAFTLLAVSASGSSSCNGSSASPGGSFDSDNDGLPNTADNDIDNDGVPNAMDADTDGDGVDNNNDTDDDNDNVNDEDDNTPEGPEEQSGGGGGVSCQCTRTGAFVAPTRVNPAAPLANGNSPDGRFRVEISGTRLRVFRAAGNAEIVDLEVDAPPITVGFAPDGNSLYFQHPNTALQPKRVFGLLHLTGQTPGNIIWNNDELLTSESAEVAFSPHGKYLTFARRTGPSTFSVDVINAQNGNLSYVLSYNGSAVNGGAFAASFGFSPDVADRHFLSKIDDGAQERFILVDAANGALRVEEIVGEGIESTHFSPCGDVAAYRTRFGATQRVKLLDMGGAQLANRTFFVPVGLRTTETDHEAFASGLVEVLAPVTSTSNCEGGEAPAAFAATPGATRRQMSARATGSVSVTPSLNELFVPSEGLHYFAVYDFSRGEVVQRGVAGSSGVVHSRLLLRPNRLYRTYLLRAADLAVAYADFISADVGQTFRLPDMWLVLDESPDVDADALGSLSELIMGTNPNSNDTDEDGVLDGAEVQQGGDPSSNVPARTGIVGALETPGEAHDIVVFNDVAVVADGLTGVVLFNVSQGLNPVQLGAVDTPGEARRVAWSGDLVAVADGSAGLAVVDIADPTAPSLVRQISFGDSVISVATVGRLAFVGLQRLGIAVVDMRTGIILHQVVTPTRVHDLGLGGDFLFAGLDSQIRSYRFDGNLEFLHSAPLSFFPEGLTGLRRLFVGSTHAFATSYPGYDVIDIQNPTALTRVGSARDVGPNSFKQIVDNGSGVGVAAVGTNPRNDGTHDVYLYDVSSPTNTTDLITILTTPGIARALSLNNGLAYVADGEAGVQVINYLARDILGVAPAISLSTSFPLTSPTNGVAEEGQLVRITANVSDDVQVRNIEFFVNGIRLFTDGNFPFEIRFITPLRLNGVTNFTLRARAIDTGGNSTESSLITVALVPDATPPRVVRIDPGPGALLGATDTIQALLSEPINPATLNDAAFELISFGPDSLPGSTDDSIVGGISLQFDAGLNMLFAHAPTNLSPGTYRMRISAPLADFAGNVIAAPFTSTFRIFDRVDNDRDGVPDELEPTLGLDPAVADTDGDGLLDGREDFDNDGLSNSGEVLLQRNPALADTDGDGISDGNEDSDTDGLRDGDEVRFGTNPLLADSDADAWPDEAELTGGSNPLDLASTPRLPVAARPPVTVVMPGLGTSGTLNFNTIVARPPTTVVVPRLDLTTGLPLNSSIARPPVTVVVPVLNPTGLPLNTSVARPPITVVVPTLNTADLPLNSAVAQPPITVVVPNLNASGLPPNTSVAQPPATVVVPTQSTSGGLPASTTIAQPPVKVTINN